MEEQDVLQKILEEKPKNPKKISGLALLGGAVFLIAVAGFLTYLFMSNRAEEVTSPDNGDAVSLPTFIEIGKEYDSASMPADVAGKLAYAATEDGKSFVIYNGERVGFEYDIVSKIVDVGGRLAFVAQKNEKSYIVYDKVEVAKDHYDLSDPKSIGGEITFRGLRTKEDRNSANFYIYHGGNEVGEKYDMITDPVEISGKLGFLATKEGSTFLAIDGQKISHEYPQAKYLVPIGESYAFEAKKPPAEPVEFTGDTSEFTKSNEGKDIIAHNGEEFGEEYAEAFRPFALNGKLLYLARKESGKIIVIYNGKQIASEYDEVSSLTDVNGRLAFVGQKGADVFIDFDGERIEGALKASDRVQYLKNISGKLAYVVKKDDGYHVVFDGDLLGVYKYVPPFFGKEHSMVEVNGKPVFLERENNKWNLIYNGEVMAQYDGIEDLTVIDGKIAFTATEIIGSMERRFIVMER